MSSLARDIVDECHVQAHDLSNIIESVTEFVQSRECWQYTQGQLPTIEVTFAVHETHFRHPNIKLHCHYAWFPPQVAFHKLENVVSEYGEFALIPSLGTQQPFSNMSNVEITYFIGQHEWLQWDETRRCFQGRIPGVLASHAGARRMDVYTMPLEVVAIITQRYPCDVKYETTIRCEVPMTVRRRPDDCADLSPFDQLPSPAKRILSKSSYEDHSPAPWTQVEVRMMPKLSLDVNFGSTHVNRRGELASDSEGGSPLQSPVPMDVLLSPEKRRRSPEKRRLSPEKKLQFYQPSASTSILLAEIQNGHPACQTQRWRSRAAAQHRVSAASISATSPASGPASPGDRVGFWSSTASGTIRCDAARLTPTKLPANRTRHAGPKEGEERNGSMEMHDTTMHDASPVQENGAPLQSA